MNLNRVLYTAVAIIVGIITGVSILITLNILLRSILKINNMFKIGFDAYTLGQNTPLFLSFVVLVFISFFLIKFTKYCWRMSKIWILKLKLTPFMAQASACAMVKFLETHQVTSLPIGRTAAAFFQYKILSDFHKTFLYRKQWIV